MFNSKIAGLGFYLPERVVTNNELALIMDTSDEWITERTGIKERRFFTPGFDTCANMGTKAALQALEMAQLAPQTIDLIVFATITPDYFFPGSGVLVQKELGIGNVGAIDIRNQCSGFIYALSIADQYVKTGAAKCVLVIGSEIQSSGLDLTTRGRNTAVIFGDGAGAALVTRDERGEGYGILSTHIHSEGKYAEELYVKDPGSSNAVRLSSEMLTNVDSLAPYMNGNFVFKHAILRFYEAVEEALKANSYTLADLNLLIPHQANQRIIDYLQQKMNLNKAQVVSNIETVGNTTAASIPIAFAQAYQAGKVHRNDLICLAAFGSGFTWASALIKW